MTAPTQYAEHGFRTRRGVMGMTLGILIAHLNVLLLRGARNGIEPPIVAAGLWLVVLWFATSTALHQLAALEPAEPQPSAAMRLAFRLVQLVPIVGTVPLWFLLAEWP